MNRRHFLEFMGRTATLPLAGSLLATACSHIVGKNLPPPPFTPLNPNRDDNMTLASGFSYQHLISWNDVLNTKAERFGFNNDFISFVAIPGKPNEGILWVNHESPDPIFVSGYEGRGPRLKEQVILEQKSVGGSLIKVRKTENKWQFVPHDPLNRRLDATTPIPLISERPIAGKKIAIGTLANCAGGQTAWGTVLTCEENYDKFYGEMDYTQNPPTRPHLKNAHEHYLNEHYAWERFFDYSPEHYGWVVEVQPMTGKAQKLCALGRFAHEGATCVQAPDGRTVVYMGDDSPNQFIYKFIAAKPGSLTKGTLYVANTHLGRWLPLDIRHQSKLRDKFKDQTEVLIRTREAAALLGATPQDRPEDIEVNPHNGDVYVSLTNNIKKGNPFGSLLKIVEKDSNPLAIEFESSTFLTGGHDNGVACPDNLVFDKKGNLWMTVDVASELITPTYEKFGNNSLFYIPMSGPWAGQPLRFAVGPINCELTGPCFSPDGKTLFLSVQHPGENSTTAANPLSHWPDGGNAVPKPSVITIDVSALV